jgi:pimeloyl-ACP methyl ester carboxylesterase
MPTAKVNGIDLYYGDYGEGTALVFAHGVGGNHASWYQQIAFFSRWYRVISIDHRGFGNSHDLPDSPGASAFVDDLVGLLDVLGIREAILVAQSMGGNTCLGFALRHPDRALALVMADTRGAITAPGRLQQRTEEQARLTDNLSQADRVVSKRFQETQPALTRLYLELASFNATNRRNMRGRALTVPTPEELGRLTMPVLFIVGSEDILNPPDIIEMAHQLVPGSSMVVLPDAGHSAYFERPEAFNQVLFQFLCDAGLGPQRTERGQAVAAGD